MTRTLTAEQRARKQAKDRAYRLRKKAGLVDTQLVELAEVAGVEVGSITVSARPKRGRHGHHAVAWRQDARNRLAEGFTLSTALGRALRQARTVSAKRGDRR